MKTSHLNDDLLERAIADLPADAQEAVREQARQAVAQEKLPLELRVARRPKLIRVGPVVLEEYLIPEGKEVEFGACVREFANLHREFRSLEKTTFAVNAVWSIPSVACVVWGFYAAQFRNHEGTMLLRFAAAFFLWGGLFALASLQRDRHTGVFGALQRQRESIAERSAALTKKTELALGYSNAYGLIGALEQRFKTRLSWMK